MNKVYKFSVITLISLAILLLLSSSIKTMLSKNLDYIEAEYVKIYEEIDTFGVFIKDEILVEKSEFGYTDLLVSSGEKISQNQLLAYVYADDTYVKMNNEIKDMKNLVTALESVDSTTIAKSNILINDNIINFNNNLNPNDIDKVTSIADNVKILSIRRSFDHMSIDAIIEETQNLSTLILEKEADILENQGELKSNNTGYFIEGIDGYELQYDFSVEEINEMQSMRIELQSDNDYMGKIISDFNWYYVCTVTEEELEMIEKKSKISIMFDKLPQTLIDVTIESVVEEDGVIKLYLKGTSKQNEIFKLRTSNAKIIIDTYYGIYIPKEATRIIDMQLGVYTLSGSTQTFKVIDKTYEGENFYLIAQNKNPTKNDIINGDKIVINSKNR